MKTEFHQVMQEYQDLIDTFLNGQFVYPQEPQQTLFESMRYSLLAGGKRLRPVFVFDFCRMCDGDWRTAANFAAAVEMVHTYSLIHDDLPCMDDDDYRRGRPTNHKVYGEAMAVLAGDGLLTAAFSYLASAPYDSRINIQAVEVLSECAGQTGMVGGQVLDMQSESRQCSRQEVLDIQTRKTGALIRAACVLGVLAGNGNPEQIRGAETFAKHIGLAFQIRDDMLDIIGSAEEMGKGVGTDANKNTFVQLYGLEQCDRMVKDHTQMAIDALCVFHDNGFMCELSRSLTERRN